MTGTLAAESGRTASRPLAGRIFGLFTPYLNRYAARIAGERHVPLWVLLRHRGRRSGREFATPVVGKRVRDGFVIPMAFGERADWYRNLAASGEGTIRWRGEEHAVFAPTILDVDAADWAFPAVLRALLHRLGIRSLVFLKVGM